MYPEELKRYQKQILEIGIEGQKRLKNGRVLVVGAGGLGCPALIQLTAAGVGKIGILDGDIVELSNLARQPLYQEKDLGWKKANIAKTRLQQKNPYISLIAYPYFLDEKIAKNLFAKYDIVIDGTDHPKPRYIIAKYCEDLGLAHIYGAVENMLGQIAVFNVHSEKQKSTSYKDLFPEPSPAACACSEAGILGMIPSSIGILQALEAIKLLLGQKSPLQSHLLQINYETYQQTLIALVANPRSYKPYQIESKEEPSSILIEDLQKPLQSENPPLLIDVRNQNEPKEGHIGGLWIPLDKLKEQAPSLPADKTLITYCKTGRRSKKAAQILKELDPDREIYYLNQTRDG